MYLVHRVSILKVFWLLFKFVVTDCSNLDVNSLVARLTENTYYSKAPGLRGIHVVTASDCPSTEWLLNNGICYLADATVLRSWDTAVQWCIDRNSLLIYPKTQTEKDFVFNIFSSKGIGSSWIGLDDKTNEGTYIWQDETELKPSEEDWLTGRPDFTVAAEDCVELWPDGWNDATCGWAKNVICQVSEAVDTTTTEPTTTEMVTTTTEPTTTEMVTTTNIVDICSTIQGTSSNNTTYYREDNQCINGFLITSTYTKSKLRCALKCGQNKECCAFIFNAASNCSLLYNSALSHGGVLNKFYFNKC